MGAVVSSCTFTLLLTFYGICIWADKQLLMDYVAILTGSPDHTILATDVETGSAIARLENAHESLSLSLSLSALSLICFQECSFWSYIEHHIFI